MKLAHDIDLATIAPGDTLYYVARGAVNVRAHHWTKLDVETVEPIPDGYRVNGNRVLTPRLIVDRVVRTPRRRR